MEYNSACTDIILTLKGSNYNGNQNIIKHSKKHLVLKTKRTEKALIDFTFKLSFEDKHTDTKQADIFRTKARYIHLFFANGKADGTKDFNSKNKHGFKKFSGKDIDRKVEHDCQNKQFKDRYKSQVKPDCKQSKT